MMVRALAMVVAAIFFAWTLGCTSNEESSTSPTGPDPEISALVGDEAPVEDPTSDQGNVDAAQAEEIIPPPPAAAAKSEAVDIRAVDFAGLKEQVASYEGQYLVLDCWATWCGICKEKFPNFVELRDLHANKPDVVFASLANDPVDKEDLVREFLAKTAPKMVCFLLDEDPADFAVEFQVDGVPAYLVYGKDGSLAFTTGDLDELKTKLNELVGPTS